MLLLLGVDLPGAVSGRVVATAQCGGSGGWTPRRAPSGACAKMAPMPLQRIAWAVTVALCLVGAVVLLLSGYQGYAGIAVAVGVSAAINLT